jgi:CO dehydrogenase/acetyl-CoA synthase gamma subunit (corrinoid Fe-S protein)
MAQANIYLDRVDYCRYWPANASVTCDDLMNQLKSGRNLIGEYPSLSLQLLQSLRLVFEAETYIPPVPQLTVPQPIESGLFPINNPNKDSLVIISGNSRLTFEVLISIWSQGITPAYFLLVDCLGSTVDMAMIFGNFTATRVAQIIKKTGIEGMINHRHMIVPGFTSSVSQDFATETGWQVEVGPICAAELPLFLGDRWMFPAR